MTSEKIIIVMSMTFIMLITICNCTIMKQISEVFGTEVGQRSMADAITRYLDYLFPKDDKETRMLKELFGYFADDELPEFEGALDALDLVLE